jgi:hypothetical protein
MRINSALAVLLPVLLAACGSSGPTGPTPLANGTFTAKIDGSSFNATSAAVVPLGGGGGGGGFSIGGGNTGGQTIGFAWVGGTGTYPIGAGNATIGTHTYMGHTWSASSAQGSGSITVTSVTASHVTGTFSFVLQPDAASGATGTRTVTAGSFDLTY